VTGTKSDAGEAIGAAGFRRIVALAGGRPCIAIGAIRPEDVPEALAAGGAGVAVASGILGAEDVELAARNYAERLGL
jgi:thiamine monophosphate synthase